MSTVERRVRSALAAYAVTVRPAPALDAIRAGIRARVIRKAVAVPGASRTATELADTTQRGTRP